MQYLYRILCLLAALALPLGGLAGCDDDPGDHFEDAGESVEEGFEEMGDDIEDTFDD